MVEPLQRAEVVQVVAECVPGFGLVGCDAHGSLGELAELRLGWPYGIRLPDPRLENGAVGRTQAPAAAPGDAPPLVPVTRVEPTHAEGEAHAGEGKARVSRDRGAEVGHRVLESPAAAEGLGFDVLPERLDRHVT